MSTGTYRDRAAERRKQEDAEHEASRFSGKAKGLDFSLLELQRKGIRLVDIVASADAKAATYKLLEQKIASLYPALAPCSGWQLDTRYDSVSRPSRLADTSLPSPSRGSAQLILSEADLATVTDGFSPAKACYLENKRPRVTHQEEDSKVGYEHEVQELSDEEEEAVQRGELKQPPQNTLSLTQMIPVEDDDFDLFPEAGGSYIPTAAAATPPEKRTSLGPTEGKGFLSLSLEELHAMLDRVQHALVIARKNRAHA